ncbi:hypothetical protein Dimus_009594 [Dionaea muscipula]
MSRENSPRQAYEFLLLLPARLPSSPTPDSMMIPSQSTNQFGHRDFKNPSWFPKSSPPSKSVCVFLPLPGKSRVSSSGLNCLRHRSPTPFTTRETSFSRGKSQSEVRSCSGWRFFLGLKLRCVSKGLVSTPKTSIPVISKKKYGGASPSILRSLESEDDIEKSLNLYSGKLSPRQKTVLLKEQRSCDKVLRVFNWMKLQEDYVGNVIHYNIVLQALGRAQRWDELRFCWIEMAKDGVLPTNYTYSTLVDVFGKAGLAKEAVYWIKHMRSRGLFPNEVTMSTVLEVLKKAGAFDAADRFYKDWCVGKVELEFPDLDNIGDAESISQSEAISLKCFLSDELSKKGEIRPSWGLTVESERKCSVGKPQLTKTYITLIDLYGKAGRLSDVADVFAEMLKSGVAPDVVTFKTMIHTYGSRGHLHEVEALFCKMEERGIPPDTETYNTLIDLYGKAGRLSDVADVFAEMLKSGVAPDVLTFKTMIHTYGSRGHLHEVEALFCNMEVRGIPPDTRTYSTLIDLYGKAGQVSDAIDIFEDMKRAKVEPNEVVYGSLINGFAEAGRTDDALYYYRLMEAGGLTANQIILTSLIKAFSKKGDLNGAKGMYEKLKELEGEPDKIALNSMINLYAKLGMVEDAKVIFNTMKQKGWEDRFTYESIIYVYKSTGMLDEAVAVAEEMKQSYLPSEKSIESGSLDQFALNSIIDLYADLGKVSDAEVIFAAMKEKAWADGFTYASMTRLYKRAGMLDEAAAAAEQVRCFLCSRSESLTELGGRLNKFALNGVMDVFADLGMVIDAKVIFDSMKANAWADGFTYGSMMRLYKRAGMLDEAVDIAEEMKQFFGIHSGRLNELERGLDKFALISMISLYADLRMVSDAEVIFKAMKGKGWADGLTYASMMLLYKHLGMLEEAVSIAEEMKQSMSSGSENLKEMEGGLNIFALKSMIILYTDLGMVSDARVIFNTMKGKGWADGFRYASMMRMYKGAEMLDEAVGIAEEMKRSFCISPEGLEELRCGMHKFALNSVVNLYADLRMVSDADMMFYKMRVYGWANGFTYTRMIRLYKQVGMLDEAVAIAEELRSFCISPEGLEELRCGMHKFASNSVVNLYADLRMVSDADMMFYKMRVYGWANGFTYTRMIRLYKQVGMLDEAVAIAEEMKQSFCISPEGLEELRCGKHKFALNSVVNLYADLRMVSDADMMFYKMRVYGWANGFTYTRMIRLYKQVGMLDEAVAIAEEMKQSFCISPVGLEELRCGMHKFALNSVVNLYADLRMVSDADMMFYKMRVYGWANGFTYTRMIRLYKQVGMLDEAVAIAEEMKQSFCISPVGLEELRCGMHKFALNSVVNLYADLRMVSDADMMFYKMRVYGWANGFTYTRMIRLYKQVGMLDEAVAIAEEMKQSFCISPVGLEELRCGMHKFALNSVVNLYADLRMVSDADMMFYKMRVYGWANGYTYTRMIRLYKQVGMLDEAVAIAEEMKQSFCISPEGLEELRCGMHKFALNSVVNLYADLRMVSDADMMFYKMRVYGWANGFTYTRMIRLYKQVGMLDEAVAIAEEMKQSFCISPEGLEELRCGMHKFALNSVVNLYADLRMVSDADMMFYKMRVYGWANGYTYTRMIRLYKQVGMLDEAVAIAEEMKQSLCNPSEDMRGLEGGLNKFALDRMIDIYADLGMSFDAKLVFHKMKEKGWLDGRTYALMMRLYRSMGMLDEAVAIADELKQSGLLKNSVTFAKVIAVYAAKGKLLECGLLLQEMVTRKIRPKSGTFRALLTVLKKRHLVKEAVKQLQASYRRKKRYARQAIITCVFSALKMHAMAVESAFALTEMKRLDSSAYNVAIYAFGSAGKTDKALHCYLRMLDKGIEPDLVTYINLVRCYGKSGMVEGVKRIHSQLIHGEIEPSESLFRGVIYAYRKVKSYYLAKLTERQMKLALDGRLDFDFESRDESEDDDDDDDGESEDDDEVILDTRQSSSGFEGEVEPEEDD